MFQFVSGNNLARDDYFSLAKGQQIRPPRSMQHDPTPLARKKGETGVFFQMEIELERRNKTNGWI